MESSPNHLLLYSVSDRVRPAPTKIKVFINIKVLPDLTSEGIRIEAKILHLNDHWPWWPSSNFKVSIWWHIQNTLITSSIGNFTEEDAVYMCVRESVCQICRPGASGGCFTWNHTQFNPYSNLIWYRILPDLILFYHTNLSACGCRSDSLMSDQSILLHQSFCS